MADDCVVTMLADHDGGFAKSRGRSVRIPDAVQQVEWTSPQLIKGGVADEVRKLKKQPGQDLLLSGSAQVRCRAHPKSPNWRRTGCFRVGLFETARAKCC